MKISCYGQPHFLGTNLTSEMCVCLSVSIYGSISALIHKFLVHPSQYVAIVGVDVDLCHVSQAEGPDHGGLFSAMPDKFRAGKRPVIV